MNKEFERIKGYLEIKRELEFINDTLINKEKYQALGIGQLKGLLIYGKVGVGKTLMADCLIRASKRKCITIRKDRADGDFIDYIRNQFEKAYELAEKEDIIINLDDLDKFSETDTDRKNEEPFICVQSCIDKIGNQNIFVIATANEINDLPNSLIRKGRIDKKIEVDVPTFKDSIEITKHYLSNKTYLGSDINIELIARMLEKKSCAELESLLNQSCALSVYKGKKKVDMEDIMDICLREFFNATPKDLSTESKYLMETAYHEAAHTVIAEVLEPNSITLVSVREHSGNIEGITKVMNDENYWDDLKFQENRVMQLLGGKAIMELKYGKADIGCENDIDRAANILKRNIHSNCVYGLQYHGDYEISDKRLTEVDYLIVEKLEYFYGQAKLILSKHMDLVEAVAKELYEKKTLTMIEIKEIRDKKGIPN